MTPQKLQQTSVKVALASIGISILILVSNFFNLASDLVYLEYFLIFVGIAFNLILIFRIVNHTNKHRRNRRTLRLTSILSLVAIIVSLMAFRYVTGMLDTLKINLVNASSVDLKDVKLLGCQKIRLDELKSGASKRITMKVNRNCSISVSYNENGAPKNEVLTAYVSESMGQELTFNIGSISR